MFLTYILPILIFILLGLFAGLLLAVAQKVFAVKTDERVEQVREALPGINCGVCGFSGCDNYAAAIVNDDAPIGRCTPGADKSASEISAIMGKDAVNVDRKTAFVKCGGCDGLTSRKYDYSGTQTCAACNAFYGGDGECRYSCLGYGDCARVCEFDAISVQNGIAVIDNSLCTGCMMCVSACPKALIDQKKKDGAVIVRCNSADTGKETRTVCQVGCIVCRMCVKACEFDAISIKNNHAVINYDKCTNCGKCAEKCPTHCIVSLFAE